MFCVGLLSIFFLLVLEQRDKAYDSLPKMSVCVCAKEPKNWCGQSIGVA